MTTMATATPLPSGVPGTAAVPAIRVLVVDDSVVMRQLLTRMLGSEPGVEVIGFARNGNEAVTKVEQYQPDLVTLDVEMPELDGVGALKLIKQRAPRTRVIMCSSLTAKGSAVTIEALMLGADDYVTKQRSGEMTTGAFDSLRDDLLTKVRQLFRTEPLPRATATQPLPAGPKPAALPSKLLVATGLSQAPRAVVIGVSTGGPSALAELMPAFPADFPLPVLIVQHMPPLFTTSLAERLTRLSRLPVVEARAGMPVTPGRVLLAPGDFHMRLTKRNGCVETTLDQGERECFCRPSVDALFRSVSTVFAGAVIAVVLTGMGSDGLEGVRGLKQLGAAVVAQDKATSVVWGMPGAIAAAQLADKVLPLSEIYPWIARQLR